MSVTFNITDWRLWLALATTAALLIIAFFSEGKALTLNNFFSIFRRIQTEIDPIRCATHHRYPLPRSFYEQRRPPTFVSRTHINACASRGEYPRPDFRAKCRSKSEAISMEVFHSIIRSRGGDPSLLQVGIRLPFMKNPLTGRAMELDGYYPPWRVAIEYNGIQHYEYPNLYHPATLKGRKDFDAGIERDIQKLRLARENGIKVISIPYYVDNCKILADGTHKLCKVPPEEKRKRIYDFIHKEISRLL